MATLQTYATREEPDFKSDKKKNFFKLEKQTKAPVVHTVESPSSSISWADTVSWG